MNLPGPLLRRQGLAINRGIDRYFRPRCSLLPLLTVLPHQPSDHPPPPLPPSPNFTNNTAHQAIELQRRQATYAVDRAVPRGVECWLRCEPNSSSAAATASSSSSPPFKLSKPTAATVAAFPGPGAL
jgi:hypothetical protein